MTQTNDTLPKLEDYNDTMEELRFSPEAKERMAKWLVEASLEAQASPAPVIKVADRRKRRLPYAAAVAALALALGLGGVAYATGGFMNVPQFVSHLFGGDSAKVEIVDSVGHPVGVAQSVNGVTVSADAVIGDKNNIAVVFSISKDDGTPFEFETLEDGLIPLGFSDDLTISLPIFSGYGATGSSYFYDEDPSDNAIQLVETRTYESNGESEISLVGRMLTANFSDLTYYGDDGSVAVVAPGDWKLSFPLNYEDTTRTLEVGQTFEVNGAPATIDQLSISPIALHVTYTVDQTAEWTSTESGKLSDHDSKLMDSLLGIEVSVTMNDGTTLKMGQPTGGRIGEGDTATCETGVIWDRILDLDEVESITIGGTTIEL